MSIRALVTLGRGANTHKSTHVLVLPDLVSLLDHLQLLFIVARGNVHAGVVAKQVESVLQMQAEGVQRSITVDTVWHTIIRIGQGSKLEVQARQLQHILPSG
jgi:hypothetical protein